MERLTIEEVQQIKDDWNDPYMGKPNNFWENRINSLFDTIEAQQQEINKFRTERDMEVSKTNKLYAEIRALTADKDEQAGRIMRLDNGLKKLRSSLQWLKETIHDLDYKAWAGDNIGKIDALLGGKEK